MLGGEMLLRINDVVMLYMNYGYDVVTLFMLLIMKLLFCIRIMNMILYDYD